jgi:hypothetical protein
MSASFAPECTEAKKAYDNCFNEWYSEKFLKAKSVTNTNECEATWKVYESCIYVSYINLKSEILILFILIANASTFIFINFFFLVLN